MSIARESENIPWLVADWPDCCDFGGDTCDGLRGAAMVLDASTLQQNAPFHRIVWPGLLRTITFELTNISLRKRPVECKALPHAAIKWVIFLRF